MTNDSSIPRSKCPTLEDVVEETLSWIGTPFKWGQSVKGLDGGCDCKGLISGVARELRLPEAQDTEALNVDYGATGRVDPLRLLKGLRVSFDEHKGERLPGLVLALKVGNVPRHLAIYVGNNRMVHCYNSGPKIVVSSTMGSIWNEAVHSTWIWKSLKGTLDVN